MKINVFYVILITYWIKKLILVVSIHAKTAIKLIVYNAIVNIISINHQINVKHVPKTVKNVKILHHV